MQSASSGPLLDLSGAGSRNVSERIIGVLLFLCGAISILTTFGIVAVLVFEAIEFFGWVSIWDYMTGTEWRPNNNVDRGAWGVLPLVSATLTYAGIAMLVAVPIGLMTAIYLSEYAPAERAVDRQAGARGPGRSADDRLWVLRADVSYPGSPPALHPEIAHLQRPRGGHRDRHADDSVGRVTFRGRAPRGAAVAPRRRLRAGRDQVRDVRADRPAGGDLGRRRVDHPGARPGGRGDDDHRRRRRRQGRRTCRPTRSRAPRR